MNNKKPTNNDITKALDICSKSTNGCSHSKYTCEDCYLNGQPMCSSVLLQDAIDLHTRQQAEIDSLRVDLKNACAEIDRQICINDFTKSASISDFAEKVKEFMHNKFKALDEYEFEYITERDIDNLLKERVGEDNAKM